MVVGISVATAGSPTGVAIAGGGLVALRGADNVITGFRRVFGDDEAQTAVYNVSEKLVGRNMATAIDVGADLATGAVGATGLSSAAKAPLVVQSATSTIVVSGGGTAALAAGSIEVVSVSPAVTGSAMALMSKQYIPEDNSRPLVSGGHTLSDNVKEQLLSRNGYEVTKKNMERVKNALEDLKSGIEHGNDCHGKIFENGDVVFDHKYIGNIFEYF